ncbi:MAG: DUF1631 domain-containing protein [Pseudomonadales bacterium]
MNQNVLPTTQPNSGLHPLLQQTKENATSVLLNRFEELFAACDDLFFDMADQAGSNAKQNAFFESLRELRLKKPEVCSAFAAGIADAFFKMLEPESAHYQETVAEAPLNNDDLNLVENEALEETVAIKDMVKKARSTYQEAIYQLTYRMDYLTNDARIDDDNNPLDPQQIVAQFANSCELLGFDIDIKIIFFKQFDRVVIGQLDKIYNAANTHLIDSGVLPNIKQRARTGTNAANNDVISEYAIDDAAAAEQIQELQGIFEQLRGSDLTPDNMLELGGYNSGPILSKLNLISTLSEMQADLAHTSPDDQSIADNQLHSLVQSIFRDRFTQGEPASLNTADEDVINLVSMFFDFVLDDESLPVEMQALLSRLQIPVLKIAIHDQTFLSTATHPLRQLINELSVSSYGREGDNGKHEAFYEFANRVAQTITDATEQDSGLFEVLLQELQDFIAGEDKKVEVVERRTNESAHAQAVTNHTRAKVKILLQERIQGNHTPPVIANFLRDEWQNVMFLCNLKHGDDSNEWLQTLQVADDLIWSVQQHDDEKSHQRLQRLLPDLYKRIESDMQTYLPAHDAIVATLDSLREVHDLVEAGRFDELESMVNADDTEAGNATEDETLATKPWKEQTAVERQQQQQLILNQESLNRVADLRPGQWLLIRETNNQPERRCKISSYIDADESFVLVNRFGAKVTQINRRQLAHDLQETRIIVLENTPIFERAMARIGNSLKGLTVGKTAED